MFWGGGQKGLKRQALSDKPYETPNKHDAENEYDIFPFSHRGCTLVQSGIKLTK